MRSKRAFGNHRAHASVASSGTVVFWPSIRSGCRSCLVNDEDLNVRRCSVFRILFTVECEVCADIAETSYPLPPFAKARMVKAHRFADNRNQTSIFFQCFRRVASRNEWRTDSNRVIFTKTINPTLSIVGRLNPKSRLLKLTNN